MRAIIREAECIGCTKCIQACPVDAILGASKAMHTVIADECTGCELCVSPCPVDCIDIIPAENHAHKKDIFRNRFEARNQRLQKQKLNPPLIENKKDYLDAILKRKKIL
jgi:electron transport complex protein RnfB